MLVAYNPGLGVMAVTPSREIPSNMELSPIRGQHMLTALVLVCSIVTTPDLADCNAKTARIVMRMPQAYASPAACAMQGQAEIAETAIGRHLGESDRIKVVCMPEEKVADAMSRLQP
jgi:hypothetical protein